MNKFFSLFCVVFLTTLGYAQKSINSPYSYYGMGETRFAGNTENNLMGGISSWADSTRVDVRNPASLGKLLLTTYSVGFATNFRTMQTQEKFSKTQASAIDYLALSFPVSPKIGISTGLMPYSSVGYKVGSEKSDVSQYFEGSGGISRIYLAMGYQPLKGLRFGVATHYNFGIREVENLRKEATLLYATQEKSESMYRGFSWVIGGQYERKITNRLTLASSLSYVPEVSLSSYNKRSLATLQYLPNTITPVVKDFQQVELGKLEKTQLMMPSQWTLAVGIGQELKWYAGLDYTWVNSEKLENSLVISDGLQYRNGYKLSIGGFFIPNYNSFTSYWKRVTYRLGLYYENTGIFINKEMIDDFGISFGVSLPVKGISNITIGALYGNKGTKNKHLVKENYIGVKVALTLNDRWFQKSKYN